jgi:uncharacterized protein YyaL (SSP411 family)
MNKHLLRPTDPRKKPLPSSARAQPCQLGPLGRRTIQTSQKKEPSTASEYRLRDLSLVPGRQVKDGKATAWVCKLGTCLSPVTSPEELVELLNYEEN